MTAPTTNNPNYLNAPATTLLDPRTIAIDKIANRMRELGVDDRLPPKGQPVAMPVLVEASYVLETRVAAMYPPGLGERSLSHQVVELRLALERGDLDRAIDVIRGIDRAIDHAKNVRARLEQRGSELEAARAMGGPDVWRKRDPKAPSAVDREMFETRLGNDRYLRGHLLAKHDEHLVRLAGEIDDDLRFMRIALENHGLGPVGDDPMFAYAMPTPPQFTARSLGSNETAASWIVRLAEKIASEPFPTRPSAPSALAVRRVGDPVADAKAESDARVEHTAAIDAWAEGTARSHQKLVNHFDQAIQALSPGWTQFWLWQIRCHLTGQRALIDGEIALRALDLSAVQMALTASKTDTTTIKR